MSKKTVIVLEDEEAIGKLYKKKLEEAGFTVKYYQVADKLNKDVKKIKADLAFLDMAIQDGDMSGLDMITVLKEVNPDIKVAMLSNYSEFQMEDEAKKAGADDYLLKINTPPSALAEYASRLLG
jgi:DNA-binding NtrC family response regulator